MEKRGEYILGLNKKLNITEKVVLGCSLKAHIEKASKINQLRKKDILHVRKWISDPLPLIQWPLILCYS